jgi:hypothetical protein
MGEREGRQTKAEISIRHAEMGFQLASFLGNIMTILS